MKQRNNLPAHAGPGRFRPENGSVHNPSQKKGTQKKNVGGKSDGENSKQSSGNKTLEKKT